MVKQRRLIRIKQVQDKVGGWSKKTVYKKIREGKFPRPVHTGGNTSTWIEDEIDDWIAGHIRNRDEAMSA